MPTVPVLNSACGCCGVKVGAQVLAWIGIGMGVLAILGSFTTHAAVAHHGDNSINFNRIVHSKGVSIPSSLLQIGVCVFVLLGLSQRKPSYLLPYLILSAITIVIMGIAVLGLIITALIGHYSIFIVAIILMAMNGLIIYFWLWVYSARLELINEDTTLAAGGNC